VIEVGAPGFAVGSVERDEAPDADTETPPASAGETERGGGDAASAVV